MGSQLVAPLSKIIHHPSASLRASSYTENTEFCFVKSFLRVRCAEPARSEAERVVSFHPDG